MYIHTYIYICTYCVHIYGMYYFINSHAFDQSPSDCAQEVPQAPEKLGVRAGGESCEVRFHVHYQMNTALQRLPLHIRCVWPPTCHPQFRQDT